MWPNLFYGHTYLMPQPNISLQTALAVECFLNTQQIIKISEAPLVSKFLETGAFKRYGGPRT